MKRMRKYLLIICLFLILSLAGCSSGEKNEEVGDLEEKVKTEISYLNAELIDMMNKLNNINFTNYKIESKEVSSTNSEEGAGQGSSDSSSSSGGGSSGQSSEMPASGNSDSSQSGQSTNNSSGNSNKIKVTEMVKEPIISADYDNVHWSELETSIETFSSSWNTIILDLYKMNISSTDITDFSTQLDNLLIGIKNKDKTVALNSAAALYSYIPKYIDAYAKNSANKNITDTKLHILNAYVGATSGNWDYVTSETSAAEQAFSSVMSDSEFVKNKEYNINKNYVALKELQNSIKSNDKTIFFIKYKNLMQELEILI